MLIVGSLYTIQAIGWVFRLAPTPTKLHETPKHGGCRINQDSRGVTQIYQYDIVT